VWIGLGVVLLLVGLGLAAGGALVAAVLGSAESVSSAPTRLHGAGSALVADNLSIDQGNVPVPSGLGKLTLVVSAPDGGEMFVGAAPSAAVDTYLTGVPYDVVLDLTAGGTGRTRAVPGTQHPQPPASQQFWTRQASGSPARLSSPIPASSTLVVMNSDASPSVTADVVVNLTVPGAWRAAWISVGVGALAIVLAVLAFWRARVARRRGREQETTPVVAATPIGVEPLSAAPVAAPALGGDELAAFGPPAILGVPAIDVAPVAGAGAVLVARLEGPDDGAVDDPDPDPDVRDDDPADDDAGWQPESVTDEAGGEVAAAVAGGAEPAAGILDGPPTEG
jgi:hypothetical protein